MPTDSTVPEIDDPRLQHRATVLKRLVVRLADEAREFSLLVSKAKNQFMDVPGICGAIVSIERSFLETERAGVAVPEELNLALRFVQLMAANDNTTLFELRNACFSLYKELYIYHAFLATRLQHDPWGIFDD